VRIRVESRSKPRWRRTHYYTCRRSAPYHEMGFDSAPRLETLTPAAGRPGYMPQHNMRVGRLLGIAPGAMRWRLETDRVTCGTADTTGSMYDIIVYAHNLHLAAAHTWRGIYRDKNAAADELAAQVSDRVAGTPMLEVYVTTPISVILRFHRWDEFFLKPPPPNPGLEYDNLFWHFATRIAAAEKVQIAGGGRGWRSRTQESPWKTARRQMPPIRSSFRFQQSARFSGPGCEIPGGSDRNPRQGDRERASRLEECGSDPGTAFTW